MKIEEFKNLLNEISNKWSSLSNIEDDGLKLRLPRIENALNEFGNSGNKLLKQNSILQIGIVGHMNVGKSTFLNSLFFDGESVLPQAATTMTAGLTFLEYSENNEVEIVYYSPKEWNLFESYHRNVCDKIKNMSESEKKVKFKELSAVARAAYEAVENCSIEAKKKIQEAKKTAKKSGGDGAHTEILLFNDKNELKSILYKYVGIKGDFTQIVKCITIKLRDERLKGLRIVDTPGTSDPSPSREQLTHKAVNECHGVFLLTKAIPFFTDDDATFVSDILVSKGIAKIVVLASWFDDALVQEHFGKKGPFDLYDTAETMMKKRRARLEDELKKKEVSFNIEEIGVDHTSNIALLAKPLMDISEDRRIELLATDPKELSREDQDKQQILKTINSLKRLYLDDFTDEDLMDTLEAISNFDTIREDYFEKTFVANRDDIISQKINNFFVEQKKYIVFLIDDNISYFRKYKEDLNKSNVEKLDNQISESEKLFNSIERGVQTLLKTTQNQLKADLKTLLSSTLFNYNETSLPSMPSSISVYREKSGWPGRGWFSHSFKQVASFTLNKGYVDAVNKYSTDIKDGWQQLYSGKNKDLEDKLRKIVIETANNLQILEFDPEFYLNIVLLALSDMSLYTEIEFGDVVSKYENIYREVIGNYYFSVYTSDSEDWRKSQVNEKLEKLWNKWQSSRVNELNNIKTDYQRDMKIACETNLDKVNIEIERLKNDFLKNVKKHRDEYIGKLRKDLNDKKASLDRLQDIIDSFQSLKVLLVQY